MIKILRKQGDFRLYYQDISWNKQDCLNFSPDQFLPNWLNKVIEFCKEWWSEQEIFNFQTSGSTGTPKIISVNRRQLLASVQLTQKAFQLKGGEVALLCLPTEFVAGKMMLVRGMELCWHIILQEPTSNPLQNLEVNRKIDFAAFVPLQMQTILEQNPEKIHKLFHKQSTIILGGASISDTLRKNIEKLKVPIFHTYGMTETLTHIAICALNGKAKSDYFTTLEQVRVRTDERNCLCITSPTTDFQEIATNDVVEILGEGKFRVVGRWDNVINSGGVKIQLENVEKIIEKVFELENIHNRFFCIGVPDEKLGQKLVLCVENALWSVEKEQKILTQIAKFSENKYYVPKSIVYKSHFEQTPTGKIKRIL
ncbi:MAG: AMP-binding protein [Raineya sp.]|nr:AMP-binding protein [Raineya sp.]MDW8295818.1 AMP-binding protein [Raineya sp.]